MGRFIAKWEATLPTLFSVNYFPWCRKLRTETMRRIIGTVGEIDWGEWNKSLTNVDVSNLGELFLSILHRWN